MNITPARRPRQALVQLLATALIAGLTAIVPAVVLAGPAGAVGPPAGCGLTNNLGPNWSDDGSRVVWRGRNAGDPNTPAGEDHIYVADADGTLRSEISTVSNGTDPVSNRNPVFDSDGSHIAWDGIVGASSRRPLVAAADGTGRVDVSSFGPDLDKPAGNNRHPQFDPSDDSRLTWSGNGGGGESQIWVGNVTGTARAEISSVGGGPVDNFRPQFSPDGSQVAWEGTEVVTLTGSIDPAESTAVVGVGTLFTTELMVGDTIDVNGERRVVTAIASDTSLTVSVAFTDTGNDTTPQRRRIKIYVASDTGAGRIAASDVSADPDPIDNRYVQWNHAGTKLVWAGSDGTTTRIYTANADGMGRTEISQVTNNKPDPTSNATPQWSPDDSQIMWVGTDGVTGFDRVFIADADGSDRYDAVEPGGPGSDPDGNTDPQWNHDGTRITWSGSAFNDDQIFVADADGTNRSEISIIDDQPLCNPTPDTFDPLVNITTPGNGVSYAFNQAVNANFECEDSDFLPLAPAGPDGDPDSAIAECFASVGGVFLDKGDPVPTGTAGNFLFTVTAEDTAGNERTAIHSYSVNDPDDPTPPPPPPPPTPDPEGKPPCPTDATPFTDVSTSSFAFDDIECIYGLGITTGTSPTTYDPKGNVTREQMAAFLARLWRAVGGDCPTAATPFTDVPTTSFAFEDVKCIYGLGITTGTTPTTYDPNGNVTREQMAAFLARLWRAAGGTCSTADTGFTDVPTSSFAFNDIKCIKALGVTTGTSPTTYDPKGNVTREQMASFLARMYREICELYEV